MALYAGHELKEFNAASLSGSFQDLGTVLGAPCYYAVLTNASDVGVYISIDGTNNTFRLSPSQSLTLYSYTRHTDYNDASYVFKSGTQLEIKQVTAAGTGAIIVTILTVV